METSENSEPHVIKEYDLVTRQWESSHDSKREESKTTGKVMNVLVVIVER